VVVVVRFFRYKTLFKCDYYHYTLHMSYKITRDYNCDVEGHAERLSKFLPVITIDSVTEEIEQNPAGLAFSFQYAKRFWDTAFRVGLFESTGGMALDQFIWNDNLRLSAEIFDFEKGQNPNLKLTAAASFMGIFVVQVGMERGLGGGSFGFVGAGLSFSDEDLKTVLLLPGVP
jgi:phospholipid/cholesterol/gamma-HCH transport system substrate-binding protein